MTALLALRALPWKWIGIALALVAAVIAIDRHGYASGRHSRDAEVAALTTTIANVRTASAKVTADAVAHAREVETQQAAIQQEQSHAIETQLADARAAAAAYAARLRTATAAHPGSAGEAGLPGAATTAGGADAADPGAVLASDDEACATAYVIATGWQDWWAKVVAVAR